MRDELMTYRAYGLTGVVREPITGWEDGGARGLVVGVYMGGSGLILKPVSGLLEFVSRSVGGAGEIIRAFGNEVIRVPKTRIRSPRQFMATGLPTGKFPNRDFLISHLNHDTFERLRSGINLEAVNNQARVTSGG